MREALPKTPLCADANCGLTLADARSYVEKTRKARLMFVEQPLAYDDIEGLKKLARGTKVPIGVDEGIHSFADITTSAKAGAGGVSLKLIKLGGIIAAIEAGKLCQRLGLSVNIAAKIAEFEHLQRRGAASCLRGAEGRLGRQPHALLSGRGHRAPAAAAQGRAGRPARWPRPRRRGRRSRRGAFPRPLRCYKAATVRKSGKELIDMSGPQKGPLAGVRVLELARILAGPWAGQTLADLGAEVIKVERPGAGDDTRGWGPPFMEDKDGGRLSSSYNLACNRGKRSIAIDFETPDGQRIVKKLAAKSDVLIENFKFGGLAKYGLDYKSLSAGQPAADLLLDHRLRPGRPLQDPRRL